MPPALKTMAGISLKEAVLMAYQYETREAQLNAIWALHQKPDNNRLRAEVAILGFNTALNDQAHGVRVQLWDQSYLIHSDNAEPLLDGPSPCRRGLAAIKANQASVKTYTNDYTVDGGPLGNCTHAELLPYAERLKRQGLGALRESSFVKAVADKCEPGQRVRDALTESQIAEMHAVVEKRCTK